VRDPADGIDDLIALAEEAGRAILGHYEAGAGAETKADGTPVTAADTDAEAIILAGLARLAPGIPAVGEEMVAAGARPTVGRRFWLVDPMDGTKEFLARTGEFTVNIALVEDGAPVLGVIHAPATGDTYVGAAGAARWIRPDGTRARLRARSVPASALVGVASRRHAVGGRTDQRLAELGCTERRNVGSSLKFCLIARGEADVYVRYGETSEWDTAAGQAILEAAGGRVDDLEGRRLAYGKPGFRNTGFVAWGRRAGDRADVAGEERG
jgi:3'(2'), 5'-bisphosphate nucleotidase